MPRQNEIGGTLAGQGNVISGNSLSGVRIHGTAAKQNMLLGNLIGPLADGGIELGNDESGVFISNAPSNVIGEHVAVPSSRNVISSNALRGVHIFGASSTGNHVTGNYIGTTAGELCRWGMGSRDIRRGCARQHHRRRSVQPVVGQRHLGQSSRSCYSKGCQSTGNVVAGNFIGTDSLRRPRADAHLGSDRQPAIRRIDRRRRGQLHRTGS